MDISASYIGRLQAITTMQFRRRKDTHRVFDLDTSPLQECTDLKLSWVSMFLVPFLRSLGGGVGSQSGCATKQQVWKLVQLQVCDRCATKAGWVGCSRGLHISPAETWAAVARSYQIHNEAKAKELEQ